MLRKVTFWPLRQILCCFVAVIPIIFFSPSLLATGLDHSHDHVFSYHCDDKYEHCMASIKAKRESATSVGEKQRLQLEQAILEVIFGRHELAEQLLAPLADSVHLSVMERMEVAIHRAKNMFQLGDIEQARLLGLAAEKLISGVARETLDWHLMVEYGTILLYIGKHRESWNVLSTLLNRSKEGVSDRVLGDFYGILGHLAMEMQRNQLMLEYLRQAHFYTVKLGSDQQDGISAHNLARAYVINMDYRRAQQMYRRSIKSSIKAGDESNVVYTRYHLVKMNVEMGHFRIAKRLFDNLMASDYSINATVTDEKLEILLKRINNGLYRDY